METKSKTLVVICGGTGEALYNPEEGTPYLVPVPKNVDGSAIPAMIEHLGQTAHVDCLKLGMTDSKAMSLKSLDATLYHALSEQYDHIVIVQGTDTMPVHAQYLKSKLTEWGESAPELHDKTFIFTGAMTPARDKHGQWRKRDEADLWQNLEQALVEVKRQPPGVYIEMDAMAGPDMPQGPWEADTVSKTVIVDRPGSHTAKVMESRFEAAKAKGHYELF